jgi:hypothetical protein
MTGDLDKGVIDEGALEELTPREINRVMVRVQHMRHDKVAEIRELMLARDKAEAAATKAFAKAFLEAEGEPMDMRRQIAELAAADLKFAANAAMSLVRACRASMDVLADDWKTCNSAEVDGREEMKAFGGNAP